jgi:hypothetical protein
MKQTGSRESSSLSKALFCLTGKTVIARGAVITAGMSEKPGSHLDSSVCDAKITTIAKCTRSRSHGNESVLLLYLAFSDRGTTRQRCIAILFRIGFLSRP